MSAVPSSLMSFVRMTLYFRNIQFEKGQELCILQL